MFLITIQCSDAVAGFIVKKLKDIAERLPEGHTVNFTAGPSKGHDTDHLHQLSTDTSLKNVTPDMESSNNSTVRNFPSGTKVQAAKTERVVRDEPGVYLTLTSLPDGSSELKRVRFRFVKAVLSFYKKIDIYNQDTVRDMSMTIENL